MTTASPARRSLPSRLYIIVDAQTLASRAVSIADYGSSLRRAGVRLLQYRDKHSSAQDILQAAMTLRDAVGHGPCVILNDRADLAALANLHGVHLGQQDPPPNAVRRIVGANSWVGISTHIDEQVSAADQSGADYIAIGPVFATFTKANPAPVVGLEGVRRARELTTKPLVAIGGITRHNALSVIEAGADAVAVISALFAPGETVEKVARDFLDILR
ncbi:MAG: thiamine phosphate synthase [Acidobacteriaceae bacterium]